MSKYGQELPLEVEKQLDEYIDRINKIKWLKLAPDFSRKKSDKQIKLCLKAFGVEAKIEYRNLEKDSDCNVVRDAEWDAVRGAAWDAVSAESNPAVWDAVWYVVWDAARGAAWDAAWDAAWGARDVLASNTKSYKDKYPDGSFINLIPLWEMGLYPVGVVDGVFIVYVPKK